MKPPPFNPKKSARVLTSVENLESIQQKEQAKLEKENEKKKRKEERERKKALKGEWFCSKEWPNQ